MNELVWDQDIAYVKKFFMSSVKLNFILFRYIATNFTRTINCLYPDLELDHNYDGIRENNVGENAAAVSFFCFVFMNSQL